MEKLITGVFAVQALYGNAVGASAARGKLR